MMQKRILIVATIFLIPILWATDKNCAKTEKKQDKKFVIVTASYNNKFWVQWSLDSVTTQSYSHWRMLYYDDGSTDHTSGLVLDYIQSHNLQDKIKLIRNDKRRASALANHYDAIHSCADDEIVVMLDGDDALAHSCVLAQLNDIYSDPDVWLTYGQFVEYPSGSRGFCCVMPDEVVENNRYRQYEHIPSHLKTFYAGLFKKIKKEDLLFKDNFFPMACNMAVMMPMMEMAGKHAKFISDVLYIYNESNPLNAHKVSRDLQRVCDAEIRSRKPYERLGSLPIEA